MSYIHMLLKPRYPALADFASVSLWMPRMGPYRSSMPQASEMHPYSNTKSQAGLLSGTSFIVPSFSALTGLFYPEMKMPAAAFDCYGLLSPSGLGVNPRRPRSSLPSP